MWQINAFNSIFDHIVNAMGVQALATQTHLCFFVSWWRYVESFQFH